MARLRPTHLARGARRSVGWRRPLVALSCLTVVLGLVAACGSSSGSASGSSNSASPSGATPISVRTDVFYSGATLPLIVAKQNGYFKKAGLDVTINPGKGSSTTLQTVGNGSDNIGYADAGVLIQLAAKGSDVEMVAGMVQKSPLEVVTLPTSGINSPQQLKGKTGGYNSGSAGEQLWPAFAKAVGIDPNSVKFDSVDIPTRDSLLLQGRTDFSFGLFNVTEPLLSSKCHCTIRGFHYADYGIKMLSSGIVTSPGWADQHPDALRKFLSALADATAWAQAHPDDATKAFMTGAQGTTLTPDVVKAQWINSTKLLHSDATAGDPFGCMSQQDWTSSVQLMEQYAGVSPNNIHPDKLWTNKYLKGCPS